MFFLAGSTGVGLALDLVDFCVSFWVQAPHLVCQRCRLISCQHCCINAACLPARTLCHGSQHHRFVRSWHPHTTTHRQTHCGRSLYIHYHPLLITAKALQLYDVAEQFA